MTSALASHTKSAGTLALGSQASEGRAPLPRPLHRRACLPLLHYQALHWSRRRAFVACLPHLVAGTGKGHAASQTVAPFDPADLCTRALANVIKSRGTLSDEAIIDTMHDDQPYLVTVLATRSPGRQTPSTATDLLDGEPAETDNALAPAWTPPAPSTYDGEALEAAPKATPRTRARPISARSRPSSWPRRTSRVQDG